MSLADHKGTQRGSCAYTSIFVGSYILWLLLEYCTIHAMPHIVYRLSDITTGRK